MKKLLLPFVTCAILIITFFWACNTPAQKVEKAEEKLNDARMDHRQTQLDSIEDYESFKKESDEKIANNEFLILKFRESILKNKTSISDEDQKIIDALEQKNITMRIKIEDYKLNGKDKWDAFKTEFTHDINEVVSALKDLTIKNTK